MFLLSNFYNQPPKPGRCYKYNLFFFYLVALTISFLTLIIYEHVDMKCLSEKIALFS